MKLHTSLTSPFGHKCRLVVHVAGLADRVDVAQPDTKAAAYLKLNPLSKVPALELEDGRVLINSPVIAAYLASQGDGHDLYPQNEIEKWAVLHMEALADGVTEAGVLIFMEGMRPDGEKSQAWIDRQSGKIKAGLRVLDTQAAEFGMTVHIGLLSLAAALHWFDLRNVIGDWRQDYPNLKAWLDHFVRHGFWQVTQDD